MPVDITNPDVVNQIVNDIESSQFQDRRRKEWDLYAISEGDQREYVAAELERQLPKSWDKYILASTNIAGSILSKLSKSYKNPPIRVLSTEKNTEDLTELYKKWGFNKGYMTFDRDFNRHKHALLWVNQRTDGKGLQLVSLKPYESFVIRNPDTKEVEVVALNFPGSSITQYSTNGGADGIQQLIAENQRDTAAEEEKVYILWSANNHVAVKSTIFKDKYDEIQSKVEMLEIPGNPNMVNPLGMLPFAYITQTSSIELPFLNPLGANATTINSLLSQLLTAAVFQGTGTMVLRLPEDANVDTVHAGVTTAVRLPLLEGREQQADVNFINPGADLKGIADVISGYMGMILQENGLNMPAGLSLNVQEFSSGLDRALSMADVTDHIENLQHNFYSDVENQVFKIVQRIGEVNNKSLFPNEDEVSVIYPKPKVIVTDSETIGNIEKQLDLGLITRAEAMQKLDPNLTKGEAELKIEEVRKEKQESLKQFMVPNSNQGDDKAENE